MHATLLQYQNYNKSTQQNADLNSETVHLCIMTPTLQRNMFSPSSGLKIKSKLTLNCQYDYNINIHICVLLPALSHNCESWSVTKAEQIECLRKGCSKY
jgi:hypothetical protein